VSARRRAGAAASGRAVAVITVCSGGFRLGARAGRPADRKRRPGATCAGPGPRRGSAQREIGAIAGASVAGFEGRIVFVGPAAAAAQAINLTPAAEVIDGTGCTVVPGFVDPHTHLVFGGDRRDELRRRLAGATYADIASSGGGIVKTVSETREASEHVLVDLARKRLGEMLCFGTTTAEAKSGYGLELETERRILRAIKTLSAGQPIELTATFMGAHEVPIEYRGRRADYVRTIIDEMIPAVAGQQLAEWCDVFCEQGVFTPAESRAILEAGLRHGLKPRIHADELALSGGSQVAAEVGARSADHLIFVDEAHARLLAAGNVVATLLPSAAFFLKLGRYAPARMLIEQGVPVALATDLNPGGGFTTSMPFVMTLACFGMNLTLEEALIGATLNAAASLDRADAIGSLEPGKQFDAVVVNGMLTDLIRVGGPVVDKVIKRGRIVFAKSGPAN
jgi:imidazolonepropionase